MAKRVVTWDEIEQMDLPPIISIGDTFTKAGPIYTLADDTRAFRMEFGEEITLEEIPLEEIKAQQAKRQAALDSFTK